MSTPTVGTVRFLIQAGSSVESTTGGHGSAIVLCAVTRNVRIRVGRFFDPIHISPNATVYSCRGWLSLLMLGSMQTLGRTKPEQHRGFLLNCERLGWMDVFADPDSPADRWIDVLEDYLKTKTNDIPYFHWLRQFVSTYQISRWLPAYVHSFLAIDGFAERFDLDRITKPAVSEDFSGGGPSASPLTRALGIGACFVVRELVRGNVVKSPLVHDHSYVAVGRVRHVFTRLGLVELRSEEVSYRHSPRVHSFLLNHLGPDKAHFQLCFDLPFLTIADDGELQREFLSCELPPEGEE